MQQLLFTQIISISKAVSQHQLVVFPNVFFICMFLCFKRCTLFLASVVMKGAHAGWVVPGGCNNKVKNIIKSHKLCLSFLLGNFVSTKYNLSGAYMPSFQKKEVGSVGQRIQLAPLAGQHTSKMFLPSM